MDNSDSNARASRESTKRLVEIAQEVMRMEPFNIEERISREVYNQLLEKSKSLAGSVISQADPND